MKTSVFVGVSVDGFLARANGTLDFLDAAGSESHGYEEFIATVDTIVMGRKTFEIVMGFGSWPYGERRVVILSRQPIDLSAASARGGRVERMSGPPVHIASRLSAEGARHVYVDGGVTIQDFLRAGLIQRLVINRVPVLIGSGIPLFGALPQDVSLHHVATRAFRGGLVQSEYEVSAQQAGAAADARDDARTAD
ncbi:MAG: dihydrofolate reductase family protein [Acidobacteriota bacterium]